MLRLRSVSVRLKVTAVSGQEAEEAEEVEEVEEGGRGERCQARHDSKKQMDGAKIRRGGLVGKQDSNVGTEKGDQHT